MLITNSHLPQTQEKCTHSDTNEKEDYSDLHTNYFSVQETNDHNYEPIASSSSIIITHNNLSSERVFESSIEHHSVESSKGYRSVD